MNIVFDDFREEYICEATRLALREFEREMRYNSDIPAKDYEKHISKLIRWLHTHPYGKAALCEGRLVGYILFAGPWDGFFGNVKGVFSPLGGSAFSIDYKNRGRLASQLFAAVSEDFVKNGVFSCALSRYAHDEETAKSFVMNGFGIRCCDAVCEIAKMNLPSVSCDIIFEELSVDRFSTVKHLQKGLNNHLASAPTFFPSEPFDDWFERWIKRDEMRIFVAKSNEDIIGFISIADSAENFIAECDGVKNICGAYFDEKNRGKGIAQGLLSFVRDALISEGVTHLGVDCETLNPTALGFWTKYFSPYTYSFARRIDERISDNYTKSHNQ